MASRSLKGSSIAALAVLAAGCDPAGFPVTSPSGGRACFNVRSVNDYHAIGNDSVIVRVGANQYYQLGVLGTCPDIDWSLRVGLRSTSGSSWICQGLDAEFFVPSPSGLQRCPVLAVQPVSAEAARAVIAAHR